MAAQLAMRFFSTTTPPASTPSPSSPTSTSSPTLPSSIPPAPAPPPAKRKPSPGPSPLSQSAPRRPETVLPSVNCKLCGLSIPVDMLGEHDCQTKGASGSSVQAPPPLPSPSPPTRRPSDPRSRRSPSPDRKSPNMGLEPPSAVGMHQRSTTLPDNRPDVPLGHHHTASMAPPPVNRTPSPGAQRPMDPRQTSPISVFAQPPSRPVVAPQIPLMQQQHSPPPQLPTSQSNPERITSPDFEANRLTKRSNSQTPYSPATESRSSPSPPVGREALSTYGVPMPDTKVGGEAGMAGVGRRGFAAVAQAALFVGSPSFPGRTPSPGVYGGPPSRMGSPGFMGGPMGPGQIMGPNGPGPGQMGPGQIMGPGSMGPGQIMGPGGSMGPGGPMMGGPPGMRTPSPGFGPGQRLSPGPQAPPFLGQDPRSSSGPSYDPRTSPRLGLDTDVPRQPSQRSPLSGSSPQRPSGENFPERTEADVPTNQPSRTPSIRTDESSTRVPSSRRETALSSYTVQEDDSEPIRRSPSPMTTEDRQKADHRVSDASSSYTTTSLVGGGSRQAVSNVKPSMSMSRLFRKSSAASSSSSVTSPTETGSIRLPFFEKLKAKAKAGSQSSSGSSVSKSNSLRSNGSVSDKIRVLDKGLPPVRERRESASSTASTDAGLAYANFDVPPRGAPPAPGGASSSIPFPGGRADSESTASSSESSSAPSSAFGSTAVGVKIVAVDQSPRIEATAGSVGMLGGDLIVRGEPQADSPTSSPSPTSTSFSSKKKKTRSKTVRQCRKCLKVIHDGKWVHVDVGTPDAGIMCEWDWKDSYLPKCRRCTLPIEGRVISASDGQITGKFHRACFTCYKCSTPFPDKTFYVHDGMPHCNYHYAEANGSLCASSSCGQPIEGACAVADDGRRFHPEHFVCDWEGGEREHPSRQGDCTNRLEDYWEVGDNKYCSERHALWAQDALDATFSTAEPRVDSSSSRATKRRTMFIEQVVDRVAL